LPTQKIRELEITETYKFNQLSKKIKSPNLDRERDAVKKGILGKRLRI